MTTVNLHPAQSEPYEDLFVNNSVRAAIVCASRGFGKSYLAASSAMAAVAEVSQLPPSILNKNISIIAPTHSQVQDIYMPLLVNHFNVDKYCKRYTKDGLFEFPNNVFLKLWSYEAIDRMRGTGQYFVVCDEVTTWQGQPGLQEAWQGIIQPAMTSRWSQQVVNQIEEDHGIAVSPWRALMISTPKGYDSFYDLFNYQDIDEDWKSYHYTYKDAPHLDDDEIKKARKTVDLLKFNREYLASFEESGNNVFYNFDRKVHLADDLLPFQEGETIHACIDFNVGIMACSIFALRGNQMQFLDEHTGHNDTEQLSKWLVDKYKGHKIIAYPDPSGRARKSSAPTGQTDFSILTRNGIQTKAHSKAPPIADSVQCVNTQLMNADGDINMYVSKDCPDTIRSLERTTWKEGNADSLTIEKSEGHEHWSDGIRYATQFLFPIRTGKKFVVAGGNF